MDKAHTADMRQAFEEFIQKKELELARFNVKRNQIPHFTESSYSHSPLMNFSERIKAYDQMPVKGTQSSKSSFKKYTKLLALLVLICIFVILTLTLI